MRQWRIMHALAWVAVGVIQAGISLLLGPRAAWDDATRRMVAHIPSGKVRALLPDENFEQLKHWRN